MPISASEPISDVIHVTGMYLPQPAHVANVLLVMHRR